MRHFELSSGSSAKFWEIELRGAAFTVRFGKIGTTGQEKTKSFADEAKARAAHDALIREKTGKGYREVAGAETGGEAAKPERAPKTKGAKDKPRGTVKTESSKMSATIAAIEAWMREHAPLLVDNLRPGCAPAELDHAAAALGMRLPPTLEALYLLHDGQLEEQNCFIEALDFFGVRVALSERERFLRRYVDAPYGVRSYPDEPSAWEKTPLFEEEVGDRWWPLAGMDSDFLVVSLATGRVFRAAKDVPPLTLAANDVEGFFAEYLARMERGDYSVEEGFGDYYLASDREWIVESPRVPATRPPESPKEIVDRVFRAILGRSLLFQLEEVNATKNAVEVIVAFNRPDDWDARLRDHPVVTKPLDAFRRSLALELPTYERTIELLPIDAPLRSFTIALSNAGPDGHELLKRLPPI